MSGAVLEDDGTVRRRRRDELRRVAMSLIISAGMVLLIAALLPRSYLANDDVGFTEYLRKNTFTPWISPYLSLLFRGAYQQAPGVPWFGLFQYALIVTTGAVLIHTCTELIERRPGVGQIVTSLGALVIGASHAILVIGITWTTVSISALGTASAAFVAHALLCEATGRRMSPVRALIYGLLFVSGYTLRLQGLGAAAAALFPLGAWTVMRFIRKRYLPRPVAIAAFVAPFAIVFATQGMVPEGWDTQGKVFREWTDSRGHIHGHTAYEGLDSHAPDLVTRSGWTLDEYRDFSNWLIIDESDYPIEKVDRLLATGGVPDHINLAWAYRQLRIIVDDSSPSVFLFLTTVVAGLLLAWSGVIDRSSGLTYCLAYLVFLIGVPLLMVANFRFPQRVSLSFYTVAALGVFVYISLAIRDRPKAAEELPSPRSPTVTGLLLVGVFLFGWAYHLVAWLDRPHAPHRDDLQALEERIAARGGFVFVYVQAGLVELDPLRTVPRGYDGLQGGWGTFSTPWYDTVKRLLGVDRGADVLGAMVDNPNAYLLASAYAREVLEDWVRRKAKTPGVRLAIIDGADFRGGDRPELYRLTSSPITRDSEEWKMMQRDERTTYEPLPGPPNVDDLEFHPVVLSAPLDLFASPVRHPNASTSLEPIAGGLRCTVTSNTHDDCAAIGVDGQFAGITVPVSGLRAARYELRLIDAENIVDVYVYAQSKTRRSVRWRWSLSPEAQRFGFTGSVTLVPGYSAHQLQMTENTARLRDIHHLHFFVAVKPGTHAGFELRNLEIADP